MHHNYRVLLILSETKTNVTLHYSTQPGCLCMKAEYSCIIHIYHPADVCRGKIKSDKQAEKTVWVFFLFVWNRASSTLSYRSQNESMNKIIAKKVCWVVWFLFSLLNKKVDFQISITVEGNLHSELHMLHQALSAHNLCE